MMPPGGLERRRAPPLACLGSLLWQSKGAIDASGKSFDAPGARDHSSEVFSQPADARDRAASRPRAFDGSRDVESFGELGFLGRCRKGSATPHWRRRFTPIAEANGDTAAMPSRIGPRSIES